MQVERRFHNETDGYRYGFNGMEKDNELKGEGNSINYEARMHDTRVGRFFSVDPLTESFAHYSPYQFAGNTPIQAIDLDGAEEYHYLANFDKNTGKIVFKLEGDKTVKEKSFLGWSWVPKARHTVVYQSSDGDKSTFVFTANYIVRQGAEFVTMNKVSDLKKFVKEAKSYKNEEEAERALNNNFINEEAKNINDWGGAFVDAATSRDAFSTKLPVTAKAVNISKARQLLDKALKRQKLNSPPSSFKEKWSEGGYDYEVRIHGPQTKAPEGSNSATTTTYRVARRKQGTDENGQGYGWEYADDKNNWYKNSDLKSNKIPEAANDTHIPINQ